MTTSVFTASLARRIYLAVIEPYDPAASATTTVHVGTEAFVTAPADTPANTYFEPVLSEALTFERSMWSSGAIGGRSLPNRGSLVLANDGSLDAWLAYHWDARAVTVYAGAHGDEWSDFEVVFTGRCDEARFSRSEIEIPLRDLQDDLDALLQDSLFAGTGGTEGGADLQGSPKPICLGECYNVTPVPVDVPNHVYVVHDGPVEAISAVYNNGKLLATPADYAVDLNAATITLTASANGLITADVKGDKTGGIYASSAGAIARRIVVKYGGLADPGDLDSAAFTALDTATSAPLGIYIGTITRNTLDVLDEILGSIGGFYGFNRAGAFTVGRFEAPSGTAALELDESDIVKNAITRENGGATHWRERVNYKRAWTVQSAEALDASASDAFKAFAATEFRTATAEDSTIKEDGVGNGGLAGATDPEPKSTLLAAAADADDEATRLLELFGTRRSLFHVTAKTQPFQLDLADVVTFTHSRWGLSAGEDFVVVGLRENARVNEIELDLWG